MTSPRSDVKPWTPEQIEAWVRCEMPRQKHHNAFDGTGPLLSQRGLERRREARSALVRFAPECPDYEQLSRQLWESGLLVWPFDFAINPSEVGPHVERAIAALWQQSLSGPVEGEAP